MSDNWVVQNLENALETWNEKLAEIWQLITQSPEQFKGGTIWNVIVGIHGAVQAIGLALLVLFFVVGVMKTCGSFAELKRPEHALKVFIRFVLAKAAVTYGMELMISPVQYRAGADLYHHERRRLRHSAGNRAARRDRDCCGGLRFFESIPLWAVTLIGGLFITVLSFIMIMTVYGRFFQTLSLHGHCTGPAFGLCGRAVAEHRQEFHQELCRRLLGGGNYRSGVHHLLPVCIQPARRRSRCGGGDTGVVVCGRVSFQYAGARRRCQNGRPCCA